MPEDRPKRNEKRGRLGRVWDRLPGKGRTRVLIVIAALVVAIVVFAVIPGYIAAQPQFYERFSTTSAAYKTWSTSVHTQASCQNCHVAPSLPSQALFALRLPGEFYLSVLSPGRQPQGLTTPTNEACASCHVDLRKVSPKGDLNIPHRAHVNVLKLKCVQCHKDLVHTTNPQGTHVPTMSGCLKCHDGTTAKNSCSACHTEKALPPNHKAADWVVIHPQMQKKVDCAKCHKWTENWCGQCHSTRPRSHTATWRADHGQRVKTHRDCEVCHEAAFCIRCHGEFPKLNYDPKVKLVR